MKVEKICALEARLPVARLRELLSYDPLTGALRWMPRAPEMFALGGRHGKQLCDAWNARCAGHKALNGHDGVGYLRGSIFGVKVRAHQAAWALHYGVWPLCDLDHINGNKRDNRIENLRLVSHAENMANCPLPANNRSGVVGVSWDSGRSKWHASIQRAGKTISLGRFTSFDLACGARKDAERTFDFHPNHGRAVA